MVWVMERHRRLTGVFLIVFVFTSIAYAAPALNLPDIPTTKATNITNVSSGDVIPAIPAPGGIIIGGIGIDCVI